MLNKNRTLFQETDDSKYDLNYVSGFNQLNDVYNKHCYDKPKEWLRYKHTFNKNGKQGLTGVLSTVKDEYGNIQMYCFKISKHIDHLVDHEWSVVQHINKIYKYCPHFCRGVGVISVLSDIKLGNNQNPFMCTTKPIYKNILLLEYLPDSYKLYNYLRAIDRISNDVIYSNIKQVLMAMWIAQLKTRFTHYDLHSSNVLVRKCDPNIVFLYVLDDNTKFYIPSYGTCSTIIDYGFSYCKSKYLYQSLAHTEIGFTTNQFDWIADPKLFLVNISYEMKKKRGDLHLRNIVKNMFDTLPLNWSSGWDDLDEQGATEAFASHLSKRKQPSKFLKKNIQNCVELIQTVIKLPFNPDTSDDNLDKLDLAYDIFSIEFKKIEHVISDHPTLLYLLKELCDSVRQYADEYARNKEHAIKQIMIQFFEKLDSVAKFAHLPNFNKTKFVSSLFIIISDMENFLYVFMKYKQEQKKKLYSKMVIRKFKQLYSVIDYNLQLPYIFSKQSVVFVFDIANEKTVTMRLPDISIQSLNTMDDPYDKSNMLHSIYNSL